MKRPRELSVKRPSSKALTTENFGKKGGTLRFPQYTVKSEAKYRFNTSCNPNQMAVRHDQHRRLHEARILLEALPESVQQREFARA